MSETHFIEEHKHKIDTCWDFLTAEQLEEKNKEGGHTGKCSLEVEASEAQRIEMLSFPLVAACIFLFTYA